MTTGALPITQHSAPQSHRSKVHESSFALFGAPVAWFVQLCSGYAMASQTCFIDGDRSWLPAVGLQWTWPTMIAVMLLAVIVSLFALALSCHAYRGTQNQAPGDAHLMEVTTGRTHFLALWGIVLAAGFSGASAVTSVAFVLLPRCSG